MCSSDLTNPKGTNGINADNDGDGLLNLAEWFTHGTLSNSVDSDGDGVADNIEINQNTDPNNNQIYAGDGDINQDGVINLGDLVLLTQISMQLRTPTSEQFFHGDINTDNVINVVDVLLLQQRILNFQVQLISQTILKAWFIQEIDTQRERSAIHKQKRAIMDKTGHSPDI